ncbi:unnamed protein product [Cyprideis torosa]|uniref:Uncharacterized protein n=1 Tax=Cyprideis torosa TaxID=163714 RepID=A0A7R8WRE4_9CRUS|nr:unnamed protein product [Cyprideis torosa]CAG0903753.1 unnamed protein product [Cyprideis torosa]
MPKADGPSRHPNRFSIPSWMALRQCQAAFSYRPETLRGKTLKFHCQRHTQHSALGDSRRFILWLEVIGMEINADWIQDKTPRFMRCPSCSRLMVDASSLPCGHTFCQGCARKCVEEGACQKRECRKPVSMDSMKPNHAVRESIQELDIKCQGCHEIVQVQGFEQHCRQCGKLTVVCSKGCEETIPYREKETHDCVLHLKKQIQGLRQQNEKLAAELDHFKQEMQGLRKVNQTLSSREKKTAQDNERSVAEVRKLITQRLPFLKKVASAPLPLPPSPLTFLIREADYKGNHGYGEAKSNIVEAGGLRWRASFWESVYTRFLLHAEGGRGAPSPWTLTAQSLTVKILRKGGEGGAPATNRLEGATFSSEKGVVGMVSWWEWSELTNPSFGFLDPQGTLHLEVSLEGAAMSPSPPPQRPTVWEAEATLQLRNFTSSLREEDDSIFSPSVHVGGKEWRVGVRKLGGYYFHLQCNPEERSAWSLDVDWTISLLSAEGGQGNDEREEDSWEVNREDPRTSWLSIPDASIARFLTGDSATVVNSANGPHDLKIKMTPLPVGSPGPISAPFIALSTAPQCSRFYVVQIYGFQSGMPRTTPAR